jgi:hypothetical protein
MNRTLKTRTIPSLKTWISNYPLMQGRSLEERYPRMVNKHQHCKQVRAVSDAVLLPWPLQGR